MTGQSPPSPPAPSGEQLRDQGITDALAADTAAHRGLREDIERVLDKVISSGAEFTADTIREHLPADVRDRLPQSLIGAVIRVASHRGLIRHVGWETSTRAIRHAGAVRRWVGVPTSAGVPDQRSAYRGTERAGRSLSDLFRSGTTA